MAGLSISKIAVIYDKVYEYTAAFYCMRALAKIGYSVDYYSPNDADSIESVYDLYLNVDDSQRYFLPGHLRPSVYWVVDTHMDYDWRLRKARTFNFVFAAQKDGAHRLRQDGIDNAAWLPLACDPEINKKNDTAKEYDLSFVGNISHSKKRADYINFLKNKLKNKNIFIGQASPEQAAVIYAKSRLVFNISVKDDINMRVFEVLSCGRPLLTNDLKNNGQDELFGDKPPFLTYRSKCDLLRKINYYLAHEDEGESIAKIGYAEVISKHTYAHRMKEMIRCVEVKANYIKYNDYAEDISVMDNIYGKAFDLIGDNRKVLDIGCATGRFSKYLVSKKKCFVTGIEKDDALAQKAQRVLSEVITGDILDNSTYAKITQKYDFILLMDILEHTLKPEYVLAKLNDLLKQDGGIILTTPNIAYWASRNQLLRGRFNYDSAGGLMDSEHVHFFTYNSIKSLIYGCGYEIRHFDMLYGFPLINGQHPFFDKMLKIGFVRRMLENIARRNPNFFAHQFLFELKKR